MQKIATRLGFVALLTSGLIGCGIVFTVQFHDQFLLPWCAATLYFLALVVASRSKGRSRAWSAWGLIPVLGWLPILAMKKRDHSDPSTGPLRRLGSASLSVLVAGLLGFVLLVSTISGRTSFAITQSGWQIIDPIEAYHDGHGVYPTTLDELEMARRPNFPASNIRYQRGDGGQWFALTVTADNVEQYDSRTRSWSRVH